MSQHKSLRGSSKIVVKRNVLTRFERVDLLKKRGVWKEETSRVHNLPKTRPEE
ncbi:MAG: small basic protein [Blastochloris sp.]|nr:small basic protein [Blastochloris sp.]